MASASYVAGYVVKKLNGAKAAEAYGDRLPEYGTMSRRPGLGRTWFDRYVDSVYPEDRVTIEGRKYPPPAYYDSLCKEHHPDLWEEVQEKRTKDSAHLAEHPARLEASEKINEASANLFTTRRFDGLDDGL